MILEEIKLSDWLTSTEAEKALKSTSCHLMHLRQDGLLSFKKRGNSYLYNSKDINELVKNNSENVI